MKKFQNKNTIILSLILMIFVFPVFFSNPQIATAQAVPTAVINNSSATELKNTSLNIMNDLKNFSLDKLATIAAKQILHQMTADIIGWVNNGFNGKPAFLTDPQGFFLDSADQLTGQYISARGPLRNLCSPWNVDIRLALAFKQANTSYNGFNNTRYTCTLSTLIENASNANVTGGVSVSGGAVGINAFLNGNFSQGGWDAYLALTTDARNQPYSSYLNAQSDQQQIIGHKKAQTSSELQQGGGFMSWRDCQPVTAGSSTGNSSFENYENSEMSLDENGNQQRCVLKTPGSVIAGTLMPRLNSGGVELELANDINAIISATISQLLNQTLRRGLASISSSGSGVSNRRGGTMASYTSQIYSEATARVVVPTNSTVNQQASTPTNNNRTQDISTLTRIKIIYDQAIQEVNMSKGSFMSARDCFVNQQYSTNPTYRNPTYQANIQTQISMIDRYIADNIDPLLTNLTASSTIITNQINQIDSLSIPDNANIDDLANISAESVSTASRLYLAELDNLLGVNTITIESANQDKINVQNQTATFNERARQFTSSCVTAQ